MMSQIDFYFMNVNKLLFFDLLRTKITIQTHNTTIQNSINKKLYRSKQIQQSAKALIVKTSGIYLKSILFSAK